MTPHLLVLDGDNLVHRYWHASGSLPPDEAIGFAIGRYQRAFRPSFAVAVFDADGPTWRHEAWPAYKGDRPPKPEGLVRLLAEARRVCRGWALTSVAVDGIEADDLIATYVEEAISARMDATVVSTDKDLLQLVRDSPDVRVRDDVRGREYGVTAVRERFGVDPERLPDWLALVGDKSDGYPGVPGVGRKTALALLERFGDLDGVLDNVNLVTGDKLMKRIRDGVDQARLCHRLATLRRDVQLPVPLGALRWSC